MKIRDIGLMMKVDRPEDRQSASDFGFRNRFIGNYFTRTGIANNFTTEGANRIILIAVEGKAQPPYLEDKFLKIEIPFDRKIYDATLEEELPYYFYAIYKEGLESAQSVSGFPFKVLTNALEDFMKGGFKNEWEYKSKLLRKIGVLATLNCKMTMEYFSLTLLLKKKGHIPFQQEILNTLPDEIFFADEFREIIFDNCRISAQGKNILC